MLTIDQWDTSDLLDWSRRRDIIMELIYEITGTNLSNYGDLTQSQKVIAAKYFVVPHYLRVDNGIFTEEEDKYNWEYLLIETKDSRLYCVEAMRLLVGEQLRVK
jgi:hypothetical protein